MPLMISSAFTLFVALGASKVPTFGLERRKPLASFPPAVNWVALLDKSPWLAFVVVLSVLLYKFGTAAIHICSHLGMKYFSRRPPSSRFRWLSHRTEQPSSSPGPWLKYLLDSPVPDSGSPTLLPNLPNPPLPPLPGNLRSQ